MEDSPEEIRLAAAKLFSKIQAYNINIGIDDTSLLYSGANSAACLLLSEYWGDQSGTILIVCMSSNVSLWGYAIPVITQQLSYKQGMAPSVIDSTFS